MEALYASEFDVKIAETVKRAIKFLKEYMTIFDLLIYFKELSNRSPSDADVFDELLDLLHFNFCLVLCQMADPR